MDSTEAARMTLGGDRAAGIVYAAVYGFAFLGTSGSWFQSKASQNPPMRSIMRKHQEVSVTNQFKTIRWMFLFSMKPILLEPVKPSHARQWLVHLDFGPMHAGNTAAFVERSASL